MCYRIGQDYEYRGSDRWLWRAWIEASDQALDAIEQVTWILHLTFPNPVIITTDRNTKFRIQRVGWGRFQLRAELQLKTGKKQIIDHWLELAYPAEEKDSTTTIATNAGDSKKHKVFLSYGAEDESLATRIKGGLQDQGYQTLDPKQLDPGVPWEAASRKMLRESDLVIGLITSEYASPAVLNELNQAAHIKPTVALVDRGIGNPYGLESDMIRIELDLKSPSADEEIEKLLQKYGDQLQQ